MLCTLSERVKKMKRKHFLLVFVLTFLSFIPIVSASNVPAGYEGTYSLQNGDSLILKGYKISHNQLSLFFNLALETDETKSTYNQVLFDWVNLLSNQESNVLVDPEASVKPEEKSNESRVYVRFSTEFTPNITVEVVIENPFMTEQEDTLYITYDNLTYKFTKTDQGLTDLNDNLLEKVESTE